MAEPASPGVASHPARALGDLPVGADSGKTVEQIEEQALAARVANADQQLRHRDR